MIKSLIQLSLASLVCTLSQTATGHILDLPIAPPTEHQIQGGRNLKTVLRDEIRRCPTLDCKDSRVSLQKMKMAEVDALSKEARAAMRAWATDMAQQYWPDTILEGSYYVQYRIRLEREKLHMVMVDGQFVGYQVPYSDKAWDLDQCAPDPTAGELPDLETCENGRIYDRAFVTSDLSFGFRDESSMAKFRK